MNPDSWKETAQWVSYKNPVVTNSVQGLNSMASKHKRYNEFMQQVVEGITRFLISARNIGALLTQNICNSI